MEATHEGVSRRTVLKYGLGSLAVVTAGGSMVLSSATRVAADVVNAELFVSAGERTMIDGLVVPFVGFGSTAGRIELPSGQLEVQTGDTVNVVIHNNSTHAGRVQRARRRRRQRSAHRARADTHRVLHGAGDGPAPSSTSAPSTAASPPARRSAPPAPCWSCPAAPRMSVDARYPGVRAIARRQPLFGTRGAADPAGDLRAGAHLAVLRDQPDHRAHTRRWRG